MTTKPEVKKLAQLLEKSESEISRLITGPKLKVDEVAARLNISPRAVYNMIADGQLFSFKFGGAKRIPESSLVSYLARQILKSVDENGTEI